MNPKYFFLARRIHRFMVMFIILLGLIMMTTGLFMKYTAFALTNLPFLDVILARQVHNILSTVFGIVLLAQMTTGLVLYLFPWLLKRSQKSP